MKNVDYVYILLLTIIAVLLLMLVMKPDPQPVKPRVYSEVICDEPYTEGGLGMIMSSSKKKSSKYLKSKLKFETRIASKLKEGWVMLPYSGNGVLVCYAR